jgi:hypothetical protein
MGLDGQAALSCPIYSAYFNPDAMLEFFNENYAPHLKTLEVVKMQRGIRVALPDGSGFYWAKTYPTPSTSEGNCTFLSVPVFCPDYKACKNYDEMNLTRYGYLSKADNKTTFLFYPHGPVPASALSREELLENCKVNIQQEFSYDFSCIQLIRHDGWEIAPDYPW